jgi:chemotaxis signal transduction protein
MRVSAPSLDEPTIADTAADAIVMRVGAGRFAVDLALVAEVGRVPAITRIPGVPGWLAGLANWRGRILPVLDLRPLLGGEAAARPVSARIVVLAAEGTNVGLLVDLVDGTTTLGPELAPFPAVLPGTAADLVLGQVPRDEGPIAVLDVAAVLRLRESLPRGRRGA